MKSTMRAVSFTLGGAALCLGCGASAPEPEPENTTPLEDPALEEYCAGLPAVAYGDPAPWTLENLGSDARTRSLAPGSEANPLPLRDVIQWTDPLSTSTCADENGALWADSGYALMAYDAELRPLLRMLHPTGGVSACTEQGPWLASPLPPVSGALFAPGFALARYSVAGAEATCERGATESACFEAASSTPTLERSFATGAAVLGLWPRADGGLYLAARTGSSGAAIDYLELDGERYVAPFPGVDAEPLTVAWLRLDPDLAIESVSWLSELPMAVDAEERLYSLTPRDDASQLVLTRRSADGTLELQRELFTAWSNQRIPALVSASGGFYVASWGVPEPDVSLQHPLSNANLFLAAFEADGEERWRRWFGGVGREDAFALTLGRDGDVWLTGSFQEWIELGPLTAYGHVGTESNGFAHTFIAHLDADGTPRELLPTGPLTALGGGRIVLGRDGDVYYAGTTYVGDGASLDGPLTDPAFLGRLDLTLASSAAPPVEPEETLERLPLDLDPGFQALGVVTGGDGRHHVVTARGNDFVFIDEPSGAASPVFTRPEPATASYTFALQGDELFWYEGGEDRPDQEPRPAILGVHDRSSGRWVATAELLNSDRPGEGSLGAHAVFVHGDWLFACDGPRTLAFRREGAAWRDTGVSLPPSYSMAVSGKTLFLGVPGADSPRQGSGRVYVYELGDVPTEVTRLAASDAAPYDPGMGLVGDVIYGPPPGEGFGSELAADAETLLVGNLQRKLYVFGREGGDWVEQGHLGIATDRFTVSGDTLLGADAYECRGFTCGSGAVYVLRRRQGTWLPTERVTTTARWASQFGGSLAITSQDHALIGAAGYERVAGQGPGAVFDHALADAHEASMSDWACAARLH